MTQPLKAPKVLLLIETSRVHGRRITEGIGRYAREHGPWSFYFEERSLDELSLKKLNQWRVDGIISRIRNPHAARRLLNSGRPVVDLHGDPTTAMPDVAPDEEAIGRLAVDHLLDRGLRQLAFFASTDYWWVQFRRQAFLHQLQSRGLASACCYPSPAPRNTDDWPRQQPGVIRWLKSLPPPTGVLCATDLDALRLLDTCREIDLAVPEQAAILGIDNDPVLCNVAWPPLSSIELDPQRIGYEAAALLDRLMAGRSPSRKTVLVPPRQVAVRESTDVLAIADPAVVHAVRFIRQWACKGLSVSQVIDQVAMSRRTLEQRFRASLGRTLKQEILRVQLEQAKSLLIQGNHPVKRISSLAGFGSLHHFAKAFRRATGETPCQHRNRNRQLVEST